MKTNEQPGSGLHADRYNLYPDGNDGTWPPVPATDDDDPDGDAERDGCLLNIAAAFVAWLIILAFAIIGLFTGCTATRYVTVPEVHEIHHYSTDTVTRTDSITFERTTIVREADSATLAAYGIQLQAMQSAWIVETSRLEREISRLRESRGDTVIIRDSIPAPYPVTVTETVTAPLTPWQRLRLQLANIVLIALGVLLAWRMLRSRLWQ